MLVLLLACSSVSPLAPPEPAASVGDAVLVRDVAHSGRHFRVATVDLRRADLDLHHEFRTLTAMRGWLTTHGRRLVVGTNAGMFHAGGEPVGLHVERGTELHPVALGGGEGNFFLLPNGVFWVDAAGAHVASTTRWPGTTPDVRLATQSGPLLLDGGALHPAFLEDSPNLNLRSGVGVGDAHTVHIAISEDAVRFWELATLFRDVLGCRDALYLDGVISRMDDDAHPPPEPDTQIFGGLLAVTVPEP
jgi:uncharacterized protein YigE (DUF2233 family)